jgi:hypothetical protein
MNEKLFQRMYRLTDQNTVEVCELYIVHCTSRLGIHLRRKYYETGSNHFKLKECALRNRRKGLRPEQNVEIAAKGAVRNLKAEGYFTEKDLGVDPEHGSYVMNQILNMKSVPFTGNKAKTLVRVFEHIQNHRHAKTTHSVQTN